MTSYAETAYHRPDVGRWAVRGAIAGVVAGVVFAMFEMIVAAVTMGMDAFFMPLRMIGGIALGEQALRPETSLVVAGGAGLLVHMMLSAAYGVGVAVVAALVGWLRSRTLILVAFASVAGFALWIVNFYVIAPIAGWNWFPQGTDPLVQFIAHTFFFGTVLGILLDRFAPTQR